MKKTVLVTILLVLVAGCLPKPIEFQSIEPSMHGPRQSVEEPIQVLQVTSTRMLPTQSSTPVYQATPTLMINDLGVAVIGLTCINPEVYKTFRREFLRLEGYQTIEEYLTKTRSQLSDDLKIDAYVTPGWVQEGSAESLVTIASNMGLAAVGLGGREFSDGISHFQGQESDYAICLLFQDLFRPEEMYPLVIAAKVADQWTMTLNHIAIIEDPDSPPIQLAPPDMATLTRELNNRIGYVGEIQVELQYSRTTNEYGQLWRENSLHSFVQNYDLAMAIIGNRSGYLAERSKQPVTFHAWDPIGSILPEEEAETGETIGYIPGNILMTK